SLASTRNSSAVHAAGASTGPAVKSSASSPPSVTSYNRSLTPSVVSGLSAPLTIERGEIFLRQEQLRSRDVLLEMLDLRRPGNRQHHPRALQRPRERHLSRRRPQLRAHLRQRRVVPGQLTGAEREPRNEADVALLAERQHVLALAIEQVVLVLHRRHRE